MNSKPLTSLVWLICLGYCSAAFSGYRAFQDARSMSMGGTGVASAGKFNASFHNPALIAFNRGRKPDKISISTSIGAREIYNENLDNDIRGFQNSTTQQEFVDAINGGTLDEAQASADRLRAKLRSINQSSFRSDEISSFSLLVDTKPVTINFYTKRDLREITTILNRDEVIIQKTLDIMKGGGSVNDQALNGLIGQRLRSSVDTTSFKLTEFGVTVATTNVIGYNMPISVGYTPKLIRMNGSHIRAKIDDYDIANPPDDQPSVGLLEWNFDIGFAMLLTDSFLKNELGLDGFWLDGEWIFGLVGMNMVPTDLRTFGPRRRNFKFPATKRAVQALYQVGIAHYREKFMLALDVDLVENEVFDFEGLTRFVSMGGEYYWRDDFHIRAGIQINVAQTEGAGKDKAIFTGGFLYEPRGYSIEASALINDVEVGGSIGLGLTF